MFNIVLYQPEIPPNTGNIIRLCANTGCRLHLIEPLGFELDDKRLRRAGLDYSEWSNVQRYSDWQHFIEQCQPAGYYALSTKGKRNFAQMAFGADDYLVFGPETRGLPANVLEDAGDERVLRLPMMAHSRSMNLSNAVSVVVYEAWRQNGFAGGQ